MKVSIVIAVYNSHKVFVRQLRHFKKMQLPDDVEFIFVDDGSDPPLDYTPGLRNYTCIHTGEKRAWTQGLARMEGAMMARGEYLFFTDIDHIITKEAIEAVRNFTGDKMVFRRCFGILDRFGNIMSDRKSLDAFGVDPKYVRRGYQGGVHGNTYAIRREAFFKLGGYNPRYCQSEFHVGGRWMSEERNFNIRWTNAVERKQYAEAVGGPDIYFYPLGRFHKDGLNNPGGLFHDLSYEQGEPLPHKR